MPNKPIRGAQFWGFRMNVAAALIVASASVAAAQNPLADLNYRSGFGANVTGGAGKPTCTVTSGAATGPGTFDACFDINIGGNSGAQNKIIQFAVATFTASSSHVLGNNTSLDGCANGQNGVTYDQTNGAKQPILIQDPVDNVLVRCINFRGIGAPNSRVTEYNFIWLDPESGTGQTISNVLVDRCTFYQATNKAFDITGSEGSGTVRNVTFQRNLVYDGALNTLVKYANNTTLIKHSITFHHNVYARGGERQIAQVKDFIGVPNGPIELINNVAYQATPNYYITNYPDGSVVDPYSLRFWNTNATAQATGVGRAGPPDTGDPTAGNVRANVVANAFIGNAAILEIRTDSGASEANIYISADNVWTDPSAHPDQNHFVGSGVASAPGTILLPWHSPNAVPAAFQVTSVLAINTFTALMLPYVGAPNRTPLDQQRLDEVATVLPISSGPRPMSPGSVTVR